MKYSYVCTGCNKLYSEIRDETQPQIFTHCECGAEYTEATE